MIDLLCEISAHLRTSSYSNEAAVREGIVIPILRGLGWNTFDPAQVRPEYPNPVGRVDYALFQRGGRPAVLIEVKAVGRSLEGDRQLFGYCFEEGVPLAILTDGRTWNFYLPAGVGKIDERRVHSLQLTERTADEASAVLTRYLNRDRIMDRSAFEAAREDHEKAINSREANAALPAAWNALIEEQNDLLVSAIADKTENLCGYRPADDRVLKFVAALQAEGVTKSKAGNSSRKPAAVSSQPFQAAEAQSSSREVSYTIGQEQRNAPNASVALTEILRIIVARDPELLPQLSERTATRTRKHIARDVEHIYPGRPDHTRVEEIAAGWLVGLNISNRDKQMIIAETCAVYGLTMPGDVAVKMPNT